MIKNLYLIFLFMLALFFTLPAVTLADTVFLKNGEERKGIVVEEYVDRIKLSTIDGEIEILKSGIEDILYDLQVQNLIKLGDFHKQKGNNIRAYLYYQKAYQIDPSFAQAKERYIHMHSMLLRQPQEQLEQQVQKRKTLLDASRGIVKPTGQTAVTKEKALQAQIGIEIISRGEKLFVNKVYQKSPAYNAGIKEQDYIVAIWNRLTDYMGPEDAYDIILGSKTGEVKLTVERALQIAMQPGTNLGVKLDIAGNGLTVTKISNNSIAQQSGLLESDVIYKINKKATRYMPLKEAVDLIESSNKDLELTIRRDITIWELPKGKEQ